MNINLPKAQTSFFTKKIPIYSLAFFRIFFGVTVLWECYRYCDANWIEKYWIEPKFHFHYEFFEWLSPWPGNGMYYHFIVLAIAALFVTIGFCYRLSSALVFVGTTYLFLLEQARYLNHFYLVCLISFLMIFIPANRYLALDTKLWPKIKSTVVSAWSVNLIRFQLAIAYVFGGIAKINADWLQGNPMNIWLPTRTDFPIIGPLFDLKWTPLVMSYTGLLLDLFIVPLLLFRKTRMVAFIGIVLFHLMNDRLFSIGIFPWFMILATTLFLPEDWPPKMLTLIRQSNKHLLIFLSSSLLFTFIALTAHDRNEFIPLVTGFIVGLIIPYVYLDQYSKATSLSTNKVVKEKPPKKKRSMVFLQVAIYTWMAFQILIPLRHFLIEGNVSWTEEGHRYSWHMKLRSKSGSLTFFAVEAETDKVFELKPEDFLTNWQYRKMKTRPYMIHQFAIYLKGFLKESTKKDYKVRVNAMTSLNGRPKQRLIDHEVYISEQSYNWLKHNDWILMLKE